MKIGKSVALDLHSSSLQQKNGKWHSLLGNVIFFKQTQAMSSTVKKKQKIRIWSRTFPLFRASQSADSNHKYRNERSQHCDHITLKQQGSGTLTNGKFLCSTSTWTPRLFRKVWHHSEHGTQLSFQQLIRYIPKLEILVVRRRAKQTTSFPFPTRIEKSSLVPTLLCYEPEWGLPTLRTYKNMSLRIPLTLRVFYHLRLLKHVFQWRMMNNSHCSQN